MLMAFGLTCAAIAGILAAGQLVHGAVCQYVVIPIRNRID